VAAPTSTLISWAQADAKVFNLDNTSKTLISYSNKALDLEDQDFAPVTTNQLTFQQFVFFGLPAPALAGFNSVAIIWYEWLVEFRSPQ